MFSIENGGTGSGGTKKGSITIGRGTLRKSSGALQVSNKELNMIWRITNLQQEQLNK